MKVTTDIQAAIKSLPNKSDFCARYDIPARSLYNLLEPGYSANRPTLIVVTMALQAEGLLKPPPRARKAARRARA